MCMGCWAELGAPYIVNEKTLTCAKAIAAVYEESFVGGNLHCEIDDWNIDDELINDSVKRLDAGRVYDPSEPWTKAEATCLRLLAGMSLEERASALAMHDGFDPAEGRKMAAEMAEDDDANH